MPKIRLSPVEWLLASLTLRALDPARAGTFAELEVYGCVSGQLLAPTEHNGRRYLAGEPGHRYELRIRNHSA